MLFTNSFVQKTINSKENSKEKEKGKCPRDFSLLLLVKFSRKNPVFNLRIKRNKNLPFFPPACFSGNLYYVRHYIFIPFTHSLSFWFGFVQWKKKEKKKALFYLSTLLIDTYTLTFFLTKPFMPFVSRI